MITIIREQQQQEKKKQMRHNLVGVDLQLATTFNLYFTELYLKYYKYKFK